MNIIFKLFNYVAKIPKGQRCLLRRSIISQLKFHAFCVSVHATDARSAIAMDCFKGNIDRYNGVTIDSNQETCEPDTFTKRLEVSIDRWLQDKKRAIWFRVHLAQAVWVPILAKNNFKFHHAKEEYVMMYRWLPVEEESNIPPYAHTNLGVGAFVYNEDTEEILVIKEKHSPITPMWKLPGGYVEPGENLEEAVIREVLEETGVKASFKSLIAFRHGHNYTFNCSDIYMIAYLTPLTHKIEKCSREIAECKWMKINDFSKDPNVHENNRAIANKVKEFFVHKMGLTVNYTQHPITKKPICIYSITQLDVKKPSSL